MYVHYILLYYTEGTRQCEHLPTDYHLMSSKTLTLQHAGQVIADRLHKQNCYFSELLGYYSCEIPSQVSAVEKTSVASH